MKKEKIGEIYRKFPLMVFSVLGNKKTDPVLQYPMRIETQKDAQICEEGSVRLVQIGSVCSC